MEETLNKILEKLDSIETILIKVFSVPNEQNIEIAPSKVFLETAHETIKKEENK